MVIWLECHECGAKRATGRGLFLHFLCDHKYDKELAFSSTGDAIDFRTERNKNILEQKQKSNKIIFKSM